MPRPCHHGRCGALEIGQCPEPAFVSPHPVCHELVIDGPVRGLVSDPSDPSDARALQRETERPIHHVHCDPPPGLAPEREAAVHERFWQVYEQEFGLQKQPFYSRLHVKDGRIHEHRPYGLGRADGSVVDLDQVVALLTQIADSQAKQAVLLTAISTRLLKMDNARFEMEKRVAAIETTLHTGLDGLAKGIRWLGALVTGDGKAPRGSRSRSRRHPEGRVRTAGLAGLDDSPCRGAVS